MPNMPEPMAGDVWNVMLDPQVGHEQGGFRPALVISNDFFNATLNGLHFVVPITSRDRGVRSHIRIFDPGSGLIRPSVLMCDQAKSQSIMRFRTKRGSVSRELLRYVQIMVGECIDR